MLSIAKNCLRTECAFLITDEPAKMQVVESLIKSSDCEKLLGIKNNPKLTFDEYIETRVLARVIPYMMWMFRSRENSIKI